MKTCNINVQHATRKKFFLERKMEYWTKRLMKFFSKVWKHQWVSGWNTIIRSSWGDSRTVHPSHPQVVQDAPPVCGSKISSFFDSFYRKLNPLSRATSEYRMNAVNDQCMPGTFHGPCKQRTVHALWMPGTFHALACEEQFMLRLWQKPFILHSCSGQFMILACSGQFMILAT